MQANKISQVHLISNVLLKPGSCAKRKLVKSSETILEPHTVMQILFGDFKLILIAHDVHCH